MRPGFGFLCEEVRYRADGKVDVRGIGLTELTIPSNEPGVADVSLGVVATFALHRNEAGPHRVRLVLETEGGITAGLAELQWEIRQILVGVRVSRGLAVNVTRLPFGVVGNHTIRIFVDDLELIALPLVLRNGN